MKNKLIAILLTLIVLMGICPTGVYAEDTVTIYFMARGANPENPTSPITAYECRRLIVPGGVSVSDVTYAIETGSSSVIPGSGLSYYSELFGQGSGLTGIYSGWMYYVDSYDPIYVGANEFTVYDNMFVLWEYINEFDESWNAVINEPVDFAAMRAEADSREALELPRGVMGDADGDGAVSFNDAAAALQYTRFQDSITINLIAADMDNSGGITANDAALIALKVLNNAA